MLDLMAVGQGDGPIPLYMHTVQRILREMRMDQQQLGGGFEYYVFKQKLLGSNLTPAQLEPLNQRLDTLESFMPRAQAGAINRKGKKKQQRGSGWEPKVCRNLTCDP